MARALPSVNHTTAAVVGVARRFLRVWARRGRPYHDAAVGSGCARSAKVTWWRIDAAVTARWRSEPCTLLGVGVARRRWSTHLPSSWLAWSFLFWRFPLPLPVFAAMTHHQHHMSTVPPLSDLSHHRLPPLKPRPFSGKAPVLASTAGADGSSSGSGSSSSSGVPPVADGGAVSPRRRGRPPALLASMPLPQPSAALGVAPPLYSPAGAMERVRAVVMGSTAGNLGSVSGRRRRGRMPLSVSGGRSAGGGVAAGAVATGVPLPVADRRGTTAPPSARRAVRRRRPRPSVAGVALPRTTGALAGRTADAGGGRSGNGVVAGWPGGVARRPGGASARAAALAAAAAAAAATAASALSPAAAASEGDGDGNASGTLPAPAPAVDAVSLLLAPVPGAPRRQPGCSGAGVSSAAAPAAPAPAPCIRPGSAMEARLRRLMGPPTAEVARTLPPPPPPPTGPTSASAGSSAPAPARSGGSGRRTLGSASAAGVPSPGALNTRPSRGETLARLGATGVVAPPPGGWGRLPPTGVPTPLQPVPAPTPPVQALPSRSPLPPPPPPPQRPLVQTRRSFFPTSRPLDGIDVLLLASQGSLGEAPPRSPSQSYEAASSGRTS